MDSFWGTKSESHFLYTFLNGLVKEKGLCHPTEKVLVFEMIM
jgi:hypothetical protein